ncbi:MAG TPA: hypothetical protein DCZ69_13205 [Syntrophobacteraceae bacterium]|nr:hypothetical protein [Syntrophobacteraceae bacterium]HBZ55916.1 hypothetical protein [Syntrophobacteraceae bacterium]
MELENTLVPIMREGVEVIKMILFGRLQTYLGSKYTTEGRESINHLAGAIINNLFATPNLQEPFASFADENRDCIAEETGSLATVFPELCGPLTDALRMQFLCDSREGLDSTAMLNHARDLKVLILERDVPLPKHFLEMVRRLGSGFHFLEPNHPVDIDATIH